VLTTVPLDGTAAQVRSLLACSGTNVQVLTQKTAQTLLSAAQKLTLGARTGGVSFSGTGHLKLFANSGVHIFSDLTTTSSGLEIHINADGDATGPGTLSVSASRTGVLILLYMPLYMCPHTPHATICVLLYVSGFLCVCRMGTRRGLCDAERECVDHSSPPSRAALLLLSVRVLSVALTRCASRAHSSFPTTVCIYVSAYSVRHLRLYLCSVRSRTALLLLLLYVYICVRILRYV
jgi:hypothetical protein